MSKDPPVALSKISTNGSSDGPEGTTKDDEVKSSPKKDEVNGSLKIHIKIDLEADIRIIAKVKGDIAIGLL